MCPQLGAFDQVEIHDENDYLLHNNVSSVGNIVYVGPQIRRDHGWGPVFILEPWTLHWLPEKEW
jgi:hypothetical protein